MPESSPTNSFQVFLDKAVKEEFSWLDHCFPLLQKDILDIPIFSTLERFACILYDKSTTLSSVNELRQELFSKKSVMMENIPPTQVI